MDTEALHTVNVNVVSVENGLDCIFSTTNRTAIRSRNVKLEIQPNQSVLLCGATTHISKQTLIYILYPINA